jgi:hypothetical protein
MRALYILAHFPQGSESYAEAEIAYFLSQGVEILVWSPMAGYGDTPKVPVRRDALRDVLASFRPDVIHIHHMTTAMYYLDDLPKGTVTVRAHSFDWDESRALTVAGHPAVRRLYAFPHFERSLRQTFSHLPQMEKVFPLPVAYDPTLHYPSVKKPMTVLRLSAGLPTKSLEDFIVVGNRIPEARFTLGINLVIFKESVIVDALRVQNQALGALVSIRVNLSRKEASEAIRSSDVYMGTYDVSGHPYGMPISIAESMATGAFVTTRWTTASQGYVSAPELLYSDVRSAEQIILSAISMQSADRLRISSRSIGKAQQYRSDVVLKPVLEEWRSFAGGNPCSPTS